MKSLAISLLFSLTYFSLQFDSVDVDAETMVMDPATFIINLSLTNRIIMSGIISCFFVFGVLFKIIIFTQVVSILESKVERDL